MYTLKSSGFASGGSKAELQLQQIQQQHHRWQRRRSSSSSSKSSSSTQMYANDRVRVKDLR